MELGSITTLIILDIIFPFLLRFIVLDKVKYDRELKWIILISIVISLSILITGYYIFNINTYFSLMFYSSTTAVIVPLTWKAINNELEK